MPKRTDIKTVMVIGSGPIVIGQACEFDYSGTQAIKALREEGYRVVLVNSNPATIMTDPNLADATYIEPITVEFAEKIIAKEKPDVILPTIGGQTGLNLAIELEEAGILKKYGVELIGANVQAIKTAEDRDSFKQAVARCNLQSARSYTVTKMPEALKAAKEIGFPLIIRPSRTMGGSGGAIVAGPEELELKLNWGFSCSPIHEILVEESLVGWKEIEVEVMRDSADNGVIVCSIENLDPMGVHTGDSITVAPIQTLTDKEYQLIRDSSLRLMNEIGVDTGGSNVQFAIDPKTGRQIVIEMNPRVSRSSALASKATGFPIAKIAAKVAIGYTLDELPNDITKKTPACFEPSIDYVVVKVPRFTFEKFQNVDDTLGTQMKSVGESMAIGRTFIEAYQKACRSLETGHDGLLGVKEKDDLKTLLEKIKRLQPRRQFQIARAMQLGATVETINEITGVDPWFLNEIKKAISVEKQITDKKLSDLEPALVRQAKRYGTSDSRLAKLVNVKELEVFNYRKAQGIIPAFKTVDTCAAEFASDTPYLYSTYEETSDAEPSDKKKVVILGGGPNRIGQGLEFDYCCVHAAFALREAGFETIMVNCNPETVSTDYDTSDRLYFEPLTLEDTLAIIEREKPFGVIVQYGGQTPLKLANDLKKAGVPIIGTSPDAIDLAEDREKFRDLLMELNLKQAESGLARNEEEAVKVAEQIGFPLMVRPSFVLGGRAMAVIHDLPELRHYIQESVEVSFDRPVLLDRFLDNAIEVDVDVVCDGKEVCVCGVMEHIERAGIHSGDSGFMLPSQHLSDTVLREIEESVRSLALKCGVVGLMNVQFAVIGTDIYVLEVNPRASRSVPFVSKVTGVPWAKVAARVMAGETIEQVANTKLYGDVLKFKNYLKAKVSIPYVGVKESVFPFVKFRGADTVLGPEMKSTGEVMGIAKTFADGFSRAARAVGYKIPLTGTIFISLKDSDKIPSLPVIKEFAKLGFKLIATSGTAKFLEENGLETQSINKVREGSPHTVDALNSGMISIVYNTPEGTGPLLDSKAIRSTATELNIPLFTTLSAAVAVVESIAETKSGKPIEVHSIQEHLATIS